MKFVAHEYQRFGIQFIKDHPEAMLLLDMGLGKTVIALNAMMDMMFDRFEVSKALVVAPLRVAKTVWPEELRKWDGLDFLRMSVMTGTKKEREAALTQPADVYVINRENVGWLVETLEKEGKPWPFDMVVIDELSSFKNHSSLRWKALRKARPEIRRIVGLTGTPAGNGLMDLWAEVFLIDRGERLGRFISRYRETYFRAAGMNPYTGIVYSYLPRPGAEEAIYRRISDLSISMKSLDFLKMPERVTVNHPVEMDGRERTVYERMKEEMMLRLEGETIDAANAAVLSGKLAQLAGGAIYSEEKGVIRVHDRKLEMLEDLIEAANGQNVLIAYWYRHERDRILARLREKGIAAREIKESRDIEEWNAGKIPVALISPASAGHGLNIQAGGHILIWFSLVWSLEMYQQTNARLWRQGQKETVSIHHIVTRGTIDEAMLAALERKDRTQEALIAAVKAQMKGMEAL